MHNGQKKANHVCVVKGGTSSERKISLNTGDNYSRALRSLGYRVTEIDMTEDIYGLMKQLEKAKPDVILNALHGTMGEDGCVQGLCELLHIPYTHSGVLSSALTMDKQITKNILESVGLACPEGLIMGKEELLKQDPFTRPFIVKPNNEGSSIGVNIIYKDTELKSILDEWRFGKILVERFIPGRELTVGLMGSKPLAVTEIKPVGGHFYDYKVKYTDNMAQHLIPAPINDSVYKHALAMATKAVQTLGCRGISRVDFRYNDLKGEPGDLYILEVNTQPGATLLSLVPEQAKYIGISFEELTGWLVEEACLKQ